MQGLHREQPGTPRLWVVGVLLLCLLLGPAPFSALAGEAADGAGASESSDDAGDDAPKGLAYEVEFVGVEDEDLLALLNKVSQCVQLKDKPPASAFLLRNRIEDDKAAFQKVFNSKGLFAGTVQVEVKLESSPAKVVFTVDTGPQFLLKSVAFKLPAGEENRRVEHPSPEYLGLKMDQAFTAKEILAAQEKIVQFYGEHGFPHAKVEDRKVVANFKDDAVAVTWLTDPGPSADFGPPVFSGLKTVRQSFLEEEVPWKQGKKFDSRLLAKYRKRLVGMGLFSTIRVEPAEKLAADDRVPINVTVIERKQRTIKGGVDYKTDEGPGAKLSWEHRNLFGAGEKLYLAAGASPIEQYAEASFDKPAFYHPLQTLNLKAKAAKEDKEAYKGTNITGQASLRRQFTKDFEAGVGPGYRHSKIEKDKSRPWEGPRDYHFAYLSMDMTYDTRDDLLDPSRGGLVSLALAPYYGLGSDSSNFVRAGLNATHFFKILDKPGLIFAGRLGLGANMGAAAEDAPADLRWYAGGGGSIRGYPYQTVGPLRSKTPEGGASVFVFSTELRLRLNEYFGLVPFLDGGSAFSSVLPPYKQILRFGAGLGFRVYTPVGPIRLDLAVPLQRRENIDQIGQVYISIGQSF